MIPFGQTVHVLKVTLRDVKPAVWRRIVVKSETPLPKFARTLEAAMGWEGYHLHMFDVGGVLFGEPDEDTDYVIDERCATVKHVLSRERSKLRWDYDFGDGWEHDVVVEAIESPQEGKRYPLCLDGKRACPPEDCGGVSGYEELLQVLADPSDPEHGRMASWAPDGFDPAVLKGPVEARPSAFDPMTRIDTDDLFGVHRCHAGRGVGEVEATARQRSRRTVQVRLPTRGAQLGWRSGPRRHRRGRDYAFTATPA